MSGRKLSTVAIDIRVAGRWLEFYKQPIEELKSSLVILKTSVSCRVLDKLLTDLDRALLTWHASRTYSERSFSERHQK